MRSAPAVATIASAVALAAFLLPAARTAKADEELHVAGSALQLEFDRKDFNGETAAVLEWARRSADIVSRYYGRFPTATLRVRLVPQSGPGVHGGKTFANPNAFIRVQLGREVTAQELLAVVGGAAA